MSLELTHRQLEQLQQGDPKAIVVQDPPTKQKFVVLPQDAFNRAQVLVEHITMQSEAQASATAEADALSDAERDNQDNKRFRTLSLL